MQKPHPYPIFAELTNVHKLESECIRPIILQKQFKQPIDLLDIGCGSGYLLFHILKGLNQKFRLDYLDPDDVALSRFEKQLSSLSNIQLVSKYNEKLETALPRLSKPYDIILSGHSLYYSVLSISIPNMLSKLNDNGLGILCICKKNCLNFQLFSIVNDQKNSSEDVLNYLHKGNYSFTKKQITFEVDISSITQFMSDPSYIPGKQLLELFLYGHDYEPYKRKVIEIIDKATTTSDGKTIITGVSDMYFIKKP